MRYCYGPKGASPWLREALVHGNRFGENALMWAAANGHLAVLSLLWETCYTAAFSDVPMAAQLEELNRKNHGSGMEVRLGRNAMQSAKARSHAEVVAYLEQPPGHTQ